MGEVQITHQEIISLCRLCLAKDLASVDIFEGGNELRHLYTKIVACLPVQVFSSDTLPHKICEVCNAKVDDFYQFWTSTAKNQKQLHEWLQIASDEKVEHVAGARIKVEVEDNNAEFDDYDDGTRVDDSDYEDEPSAPKRIKTTHSDDEEDRKPTDLVGSMPESSDASGKKKTKDHKWTPNADEKSRLADTEDESKCHCDLCGKSYKDRTAIHSHMVYAHLRIKKPLSCDFCDKSFLKKTEWTKHRRVVHGVGLLSKPKYAQACTEEQYKEIIQTNSKTCPLCKKIYKNVKTMRRHLKDQHRFAVKAEKEAPMVHFPVKRTCGTCGLVLDNMTELRLHMRSSHPGVKYYPCYYCDVVLSRKRQKYRHNTENHHGLPFIPVFTCPICNKSIKNKDCYDDHVSAHEGEKRHACDICSAKFSNYYQLKNHKLIHFPRPKKTYTCDKCGELFNSRSAYGYHKYKVHDKKNWQCPVCGKVLASYNINHLRIHETQLKYVCETCGKRFNCPQYLSDHRAAHHSSVKPYPCKFCNKRFTQRTPRSLHMRKFHTGETRYECNTCNVRFVTKLMLTKHIISHSL